jgi:hypothetical protein
MYLMLCCALLLSTSCTLSDEPEDAANESTTTEGGKARVKINVDLTHGITSEDNRLPLRADECVIKDMCILAVPTSTSYSTVRYKVDDTDFSNNSVSTELDLTVGATYYIYVFANLDPDTYYDGTGYSTLAYINSATSVSSLSYARIPFLNGFLPQRGYLPMVYESSSYTISANSNITVNARLQFACTKVVLNVYQDGGSVDNFVSVLANYVGSATYLLSYPYGDMTYNYSYTQNGISPNESGYYDDWEFNSNDSTSDDELYIIPDGAVKSMPTDGRHWLYSATFYLPEHYVAAAYADYRTKLAITIGGKTYGLTIGDPYTTDGNYSGYMMNRNRFYEYALDLSGLTSVSSTLKMGLDINPLNAELEIKPIKTMAWK